MKRISCILFATIIFQHSFEQSAIQGIMTYENDYDDALGTGKVITTIYESDSKARIESSNTLTKSSIGPPSSQNQNVIIYNFDNMTEMHILQISNMARVSPISASVTEQTIARMGTDLLVQNMGQETVGTYNCTHFVLTISSSKIKMPASKKDIWVTKDLGFGNIFYVGPYLYYPRGGTLAKKLSDAGVTGVVVKWQIIDPVSKKPNVATLQSFQNKKIPASSFQAPAGSTIVQH